MLTNYFRTAILNVFRGTPLAALTGYLGTFNAMTNWRAGTVTEVAYTGYTTRPAITFAAPAETDPIGGMELVNSVAVDLQQNTGTDVPAIGWGFWDSPTPGAGNLCVIGMLDADQPFVGVGDPVAEDIYARAHGLAVGQRVFVMAAPGAVLPAGLAENIAYYVIAGGLTVDNFRLSTTSGGAAVDITARGAAMFIPYTSQTIAALATPNFAIGQLGFEL